MTTTHIRILAAGLLLAGQAVLQPARAAESYDACAGFIDSLPATISQQGVWCLRKDLSTSITSGNVITIATNNVTIDCNGFKLGGLAAGDASWARGIGADSRNNVTVRNCNIRGFGFGIWLTSGAGHLIEDNRLDNNLLAGIVASGDNIRVHRNAIYDTGGSTGASSATGIDIRGGEVVDNSISGLFTNAPGGMLIAISAWGSGTDVSDNRISGFDATAAQGGVARGIQITGELQRASGNHIVGDANALSGQGIYSSSSTNYCLGNTVGGFTTNVAITCTSSGNLTPP